MSTNAQQGRIVCWFSCGAASAIATKLMLGMNVDGHELVIASNHIHEEHPDNKRFLKECEVWFGHPVEVLHNEKYDSSIYEVFRRERFLVGPSGAACTRLLKKDMRKKFQRPDDIHVFGFTAEEESRLDDFRESNPHQTVRAPLIERGLNKADCLAMLGQAGIELPTMYKLGYRNNNCIGCVKGGAGYWNKIRIDFPDVFEKMAQMEERLGRTINVDRAGGVRKRISLRELHPDAGRHQEEPDISCSAVCVQAANEMI